jgi:hypothetical protein
MCPSVNFIKWHGEVAVLLHTFLISKLDGGGWLALHPGRRKERPLCPLNGRPGEPQSRSKHFGEEQNHLLVPWIEPRSLGRGEAKPNDYSGYAVSIPIYCIIMYCICIRLSKVYELNTHCSDITWTLASSVKETYEGMPRHVNLFWFEAGTHLTYTCIPVTVFCIISPLFCKKGLTATLS